MEKLKEIKVSYTFKRPWVTHRLLPEQMTSGDTHTVCWDQRGTRGRKKLVVDSIRGS